MEVSFHFRGVNKIKKLQFKNSASRSKSNIPVTSYSIIHGPHCDPALELLFKGLIDDIVM